MSNKALKRLSVLIWLVFSANLLVTPAHAVGMVALSGEAAISDSECPMHVEHDASSNEDPCVCPGGGCSLSGADKLAVLGTSTTAEATEQPDEFKDPRRSGLPVFSSPRGFNSRAPPVSSPR